MAAFGLARMNSHDEETMKVKDLIAELQKLDAELPVFSGFPVTHTFIEEGPVFDYTHETVELNTVKYVVQLRWKLKPDEHLNDECVLLVGYPRLKPSSAVTKTDCTIGEPK